MREREFTRIRSSRDFLHSRAFAGTRQKRVMMDDDGLDGPIERQGTTGPLRLRAGKLTAGCSDPSIISP